MKNRKHLILETIGLTGIIIKKHSFLLLFFLLTSLSLFSQSNSTRLIRGNVTDRNGELLPGVTVVIKNTQLGTITDLKGSFSLQIPQNAQTLQFSFIGLKTKEISIDTRTTYQVTLEEETFGIDEVIVIGYGVQKKSDITGSVASLSTDRLSSMPNQNIAQALQGSIPGVSVLTTSAGANPSQNIMIRGRNSIRASNDPLVVIDGVPFEGILNDINPNDIKSIEILKDASSAAIYGSRGSNGVILITTKAGESSVPKISYNGYYSIQQFTKLPDVLSAEEFYAWKKERSPGAITASEQAVYDSGEWSNWLDLALRDGRSIEHNISMSGSNQKTKYYLSGSLTDVQGLAINDNYKRVTTRMNLESNVRDWITLGARVNLTYQDKSGLSPTWGGDHGVFTFNPLTKAYDNDGNLLIYPWPEDNYLRNPLMNTLADHVDETYSGVLNNYVIVRVPFIKGLEYRLNTGISAVFRDNANYFGRNTTTGFENRGTGFNNRTRSHKTVLENILSYQRSIEKHNIYFTGVYSFENFKSSSNSLTTRGYPNDFLSWYGGGQAEFINPNFDFTERSLISQMLRLNYGYDSRYLLTLTARRDGYSGFGSNNKWGTFPSAALAWNAANEKFFPIKEIVNELKLRLSYGKNGNQAISPYETISRLAESNTVAGSTTMPGYFPSVLGVDNLTWESTTTLNLGVDFGLFKNRITGDINVYKSNTTDLLLNRTISGTHGITSIVQNIGETENRGIELSIVSRNISRKNFQWRTNANYSFVRNKIVSLYGLYDENGVEVNDINNRWFIGQPIRVNYAQVWAGVWQLDEAEEAAKYGTVPGYIKIKDVNTDGVVNALDREIQGQLDPLFMWGMNNTFTYKNWGLSIFIHGVHGVTKTDPLMYDGNMVEVRYNVTRKNWWTPDNPTNDWYKNDYNAHRQNGISADIYQDASFIRIKDVVLSYNISDKLLKNIGFDNVKLYLTGRNLHTFTKYTGLDPELSSQGQVPLQKEYVFGVNFGF